MSKLVKREFDLNEIEYVDAHTRRWGCFLIHDSGEVFNLWTESQCAVFAEYKDQYRKVRFKYHGEKITIPIHRLVALCFIPTTNQQLDVNHLDGNKWNDSVLNLEWVTRRENVRHSIDILHHKPGKYIGFECIFQGKYYKTLKNLCGKQNLPYTKISVNKLILTGNFIFLNSENDENKYYKKSIDSIKMWKPLEVSSHFYDFK